MLSSSHASIACAALAHSALAVYTYLAGDYHLALQHVERSKTAAASSESDEATRVICTLLVTECLCLVSLNEYGKASAAIQTPGISGDQLLELSMVVARRILEPINLQNPGNDREALEFVEKLLRTVNSQSEAVPMKLMTELARLYTNWVGASVTNILEFLASVPGHMAGNAVAADGAAPLVAALWHLGMKFAQMERHPLVAFNSFMLVRQLTAETSSDDAETHRIACLMALSALLKCEESEVDIQTVGLKICQESVVLLQANPQLLQILAVNEAQLRVRLARTGDTQHQQLQDYVRQLLSATRNQTLQVEDPVRVLEATAGVVTDLSLKENILETALKMTVAPETKARILRQLCECTASQPNQQKAQEVIETAIEFAISQGANLHYAESQWLTIHCWKQAKLNYILCSYDSAVLMMSKALEMIPHCPSYVPYETAMREDLRTFEKMSRSH